MDGVFGIVRHTRMKCLYSISMVEVARQRELLCFVLHVSCGTCAEDSEREGVT
jgi:hypothetical protein